MPTLTQKTLDVRQVLDEVDLNLLADALRKIKMGKMASVIKVVVAGIAAAASFDVTTAAFKAASTITGIRLDSNELLPAIGQVIGLRVVTSAGAVTIGPRVMTDVGGTPTAPAGAAPGVATLSDDGKTITFEANGTTALVLEYVPRAAVAPTTEMVSGL